MTGEAFSLPTFTMADYILYRLDDPIFWGFVLMGLIFCLIHGGRRAFRHPRPTESSDKENSLMASTEEEIERHTLFQRIFHWSNAGAVMVLTISGWMIY